MVGCPRPIPQIEGGTRPSFFFWLHRVLRPAPRVDRRGAGPLKDWSRLVVVPGCGRRTRGGVILMASEPEREGGSTSCWVLRHLLTYTGKRYVGTWGSHVRCRITHAQVRRSEPPPRFRSGRSTTGGLITIGTLNHQRPGLVNRLPLSTDLKVSVSASQRCQW